MAAATTMVINHGHSAVIESAPATAGVQQEQDLSPAALKTFVYLLAGGAVFLAVLGTYVISGIYRFQNCL